MGLAGVGTRLRFRNHPHGDAAVGGRILPLHAPRQHIHRALRLPQTHARFHAPEHRQRTAPAIGEQRIVVAVRAKRHVAFEIQTRVRTMKFRRRHAQDPHRDAVHANLLADDIGPSAIALLPEGVAQNDGRIRARILAFAGLEQSADGGANRQRWKEVPGDLAVHEWKGFPADADAPLIDRVSEQVAEAVRLTPEILERGEGKAVPESGFIASGLGGEHDDLLRVVSRQRLENAVHHAENGRVRADPQRHRQHHQQRKSPVGPKLARGVAKILKEGLHCLKPV